MPTDAQSAEERRLFKRFSARFPVKFKDERDEYGTDVFLQDASAQGMRILTKDRFFRGDNVALNVELPDGKEPMVLSGRVVWAKPSTTSLWDTGVQFNQVDFLGMQRLFRLAEALLQP
jgi:Tfp pilus assembly protein PilZ